jgi:hypothetical protein
MISRMWFYTYDTKLTDVADTTILPGSFLDLRGDGTYSLDFNGFETGTWQFINDNELILTSDQKKQTNIAVKYVSEKSMNIFLFQRNFEFEGLPNNGMTGIEDPFSRQNNQWRIHATAKETDQQIAARLANHFQFWEAYFNWGLAHHIDYLDVRSTATPIKIYGNGFTLKPFNQLPVAWKRCFYDEEGCRKANDKIKQLFDNNTITWPHTDNKFKMFLSAFQQLRRAI